MIGGITVLHADCRDALKEIADNSVDSCCTDPPYALVSIVKRFGKAGSAPAKGNEAYTRASAGFMGQQWDTGEVAFDPEFWRGVLRVLKPGAHLVAFSGTRTYHRMAVAIEDAGFEVRDMIAWEYGSGFPKSHSVSKAIDGAAGAERAVVGHVRAGISRASRNGGEICGGTASEELKISPVTEPATQEAQQWDGWGTALKPALEPICLARKPLSERTVAANVLRWGTGALNIKACRIESERETGWGGGAAGGNTWDATNSGLCKEGDARPVSGRWPANIVTDGSDEVLAAYPDAPGQQQDVALDAPSAKTGNVYGKMNRHGEKSADARYADKGSTTFAALPGVRRGDSGSAARFFYSAKADADDRFGSKHPTVKPIDLMRWLTRLVTPPGGLVLDPFAGSGTTGVACIAEGFKAVLVEREERFVADINARLDYYAGKGPMAAQMKVRNKKPKPQAGTLFDEVAP